MKKRIKKYNPKPINRNPLGYAIESVTLLKSHDDSLLKLSMINDNARVALMTGKATNSDLNTLIGMSNIVQALLDMGFGDEYSEIATEARYSLLSILERASKIKKFVAKGDELTSINKLFELHDAQLEIVTVGEVEKAIRTVENKLKNKQCFKASLFKGENHATV